MLHSVGVWRSLVARFVRDEEVRGSSPRTPTTLPPPAWADRLNLLCGHFLWISTVLVVARMARLYVEEQQR